MRWQEPKMSARCLCPSGAHPARIPGEEFAAQVRQEVSATTVQNVSPFGMITAAAERHQSASVVGASRMVGASSGCADRGDSKPEDGR